MPASRCSSAFATAEAATFASLLEKFPLHPAGLLPIHGLFCRSLPLETLALGFMGKVYGEKSP